jgi:nicotinate phosphoribosyltransferase
MENEYGYGLAGENAIAEGEVTDAYFLRTEEALEEAGHNPYVRAEVTADQFSDGETEVFCGLKETVHLLGESDEFNGLPINLYSIPEGAEFDGGPVMLIGGHYQDFARYETAVLGLLSQASGYATAAREVFNAADETPVLSFGSRHIHPAMAPYMERAAAIGGNNGYSNVGAADVFGPDHEPSGTMPHALMLSFGRGNQEEAWDAFNEGVDDDVPRIVLVDTFSDEVDEACRACFELGSDLDGIRLDTTGSRRGDFKHIIREVRYELDEIGRDDVDIYVSGGIDAEAVRNLKDYVDGFGIGSAVTNADPVDFGLDIVEVDGEPISKRGKLSGVKDSAMSQYIDNGEVIRDI